MSIFEQLVSNKAITIPILCWFTAQVMKVIIPYIRNGQIDFRRLLGSGGMPSSHTSFTVCLAIVLGKNYGFDSGIFALSFAFSTVVMADAAGVRRSAGKQAEVLNKLIHSHGEIHLDKELKVLLGHTPFEVIAGAALGIFYAVMMG